MSVLDDLRGLYDDAGDEDTHLDLDIPCARGKLVIRYRAPETRSEINAPMQRLLTEGPMSNDADLDLIAACTSEILKREDGKLTSLAEDGKPVRFDADDKRLTDALGITYLTARDAVRGTFKLDRFPTSTVGHVERLMPFLQGLDEYARSRVEGESGAASAATSTTPSTSS